MSVIFVLVLFFFRFVLRVASGDAVAEAGDAERCRGRREHGEPGEDDRCWRSVNSAAPGRDREKESPRAETGTCRRPRYAAHRWR